MAFGWPGKEIQGRRCQLSEEVGTIFNSKQSLKTLLKSDTCDEWTCHHEHEVATVQFIGTT